MRWKIIGSLWVILFFYSCSVLIAKEPPPVNFLLITIDTIRPDHLGCYGYQKIKTPHIDRLAQKGILFENAFSPVPLTLPSHTTILTGTCPAFHGIRNNGTYAVSDSTMTLAELLKDKGYMTAAFVASYVLDERFGLDQGFDVYNDDLSDGKEQLFEYKERRAEDVTQAAIHWLKEKSPGKFFLWIHYFDPHLNYNPPPPFSIEYADNLYDGEIAYTDHWLGILMDALHKSVLAENTVIILTGDHGEGLGEHKEKTHGIFIYDTTLKVPFIINCPQLFPTSKRFKSLVRLIDIAPTVLAIAGCDIYQDMQGVSLLPLMQGKVDKLDLVLYCESFYPLYSHHWSPLEGVRTEKWKYIDAPVKELYRVDKDLSEDKNIFNQKKSEAQKLALKLSEFKDTMASAITKPVAREMPLDEEARERFQSLGYIFTSNNMGEKEEYPDPKKMIDMLEYMDQGLEFFGKKEYQKARDKFLKVVQKCPQDVDAYIILGHTYDAMGQYEESIKAFEEAMVLGCKDLRIYIKLGTLYMKYNQDQNGVAILHEALKVNPGCKEAFILLGLHYFKKNEIGQAMAQFQKTLEIDPYDLTALKHLAVIYQSQKQFDPAISVCQTALKIDPNSISALITLGSTLIYKGQYIEALDALERALKIDPDAFRAHYFAGLATFQQKKTDQAIRYFKNAVQLNPNWAAPHFNLGFIYHQQGKLSQALDEYQTALKLKPDLMNARRMIQQINLQLKHQ